MEQGAECIKVDYNGFESGIKGDNVKMKAAFENAYSQTEQELSDIEWNLYEDIIFISKSIGTAVAARYARDHRIICRNVYLTPLVETFLFAPGTGIAFNGTSDTWADAKIIKEKCSEYNIKLYTISDADHSLERLGTVENIKIIQDTIEKIKEYIM